MAVSKMTKSKAYESVARSLREFGYPDVTASMIQEIYEAMLQGKSGHDLPHGIVGMMAERQIEEVRADFDKLPA